MRKRLRLALSLAVAGVLAAPVTVLGVHVTDRRDEDGYLAYLKQYGDPHSDGPVPVLPPAADLLAEGDTACDWMREQPYALWRTDPEHRFPAVYERHLQHVAGRSPSWGHCPARDGTRDSGRLGIPLPQRSGSCGSPVAAPLPQRQTDRCASAESGTRSRPVLAFVGYR